MLLGGPGPERTSEAAVVGLLTLALTNRIVSQRHESFQCQIDCDALHRCFPFVPVAERQQHARVLPGLAGAVQIGRYKQAWQALKDNFLDYVSGPLEASGHPCI